MRYILGYKVWGYEYNVEEEDRRERRRRQIARDILLGEPNSR